MLGVLATKLVMVGAATMVEVAVPGAEAVAPVSVATTLKETLPLAAGVKVIELVPAPAVTLAPVTVQA
jgi:hypothetical protein